MWASRARLSFSSRGRLSHLECFEHQGADGPGSDGDHRFAAHGEWASRRKNPQHATVERNAFTQDMYRGIKRAAKAYRKAKLKTDYYNPQIHAAAFALPQWIKKLVP